MAPVHMTLIRLNLLMQTLYFDRQTKQEHLYALQPNLHLLLCPLFCFLMTGRTCCVTRITPKKLVSNCAFISSIDISSRDRKSPYPALFTNTSILLFSAATISSIASLTDLSSLTSS